MHDIVEAALYERYDPVAKQLHHRQFAQEWPAPLNGSPSEAHTVRGAKVADPIKERFRCGRIILLVQRAGQDARLHAELKLRCGDAQASLGVAVKHRPRVVEDMEYAQGHDSERFVGRTRGRIWFDRRFLANCLPRGRQ